MNIQSELQSRLKDLKIALEEQEKSSLRINHLEFEKNRILKELAEANSFIQAADTELEILRERKMTLTKEIKSLEVQAKQQGEIYEETHPGGLKNNFEGALQAAKGQRVVWDEDRAKEWLYHARSYLSEEDYLSLIKPDKKAFEKLVKKNLFDVNGPFHISEVIHWEDSVTMKLMKAKLLQMEIPGGNEFEEDELIGNVEDKFIDSAIGRLADNRYEYEKEVDTQLEEDAMSGLAWEI